MKKRIEWVDICKGFGMVLVMLGHAPFPWIVRREIYTFHIPLFFFLSGYLFSFTKYKSFISFFKSKFCTLLIPYFSFSMLNYIYWIIVDRSIMHKVDSSISIFTPLIGTFYGLRNTPSTLHNSTLWFINCLFICNILFYFIVKFTNDNTRKISVVLVLFSILGYLYSIFINKALPWSIDASFIAIVFIGIGYLVKNKLYFENIKLRYAGILILINLLCGVLNRNVDMFYNLYGNQILFYLSAVSGVLASIIVITKLRPIKVLSYIGKNSIFYLAFHLFIIFPLVAEILKHISLFRIQNNIMLFITGISYMVFAVLAIVPIIYIINNYAPLLIGKNIFKGKKKSDNIVETGIV